MLAQDRETALYFLKLAKLAGSETRAKSISNLIINKLLPWSVTSKIPLDECPVSPSGWLELLDLIESGQLSASTAYQRLFPALLEKPAGSPTRLATEMNLLQSADSDFLDQIAAELLDRFPEKVAEYRKGKKGLIGFFMGELMKMSKGKAEPKAATKVLEDKLNE